MDATFVRIAEERAASGADGYSLPTRNWKSRAYSKRLKRMKKLADEQAVHQEVEKQRIIEEAAAEVEEESRQRILEEEEAAKRERIIEEEEDEELAAIFHRKAKGAHSAELKGVVELDAIQSLEVGLLAVSTTFSAIPTVFTNGKDSTPPTGILQSVEHHPKAGKYFMIRSRAEPYYILAIENGELRLLTKPTLGVSPFWYCDRTNGWYTFRNSVTGTYLCLNDQGSISAEQSYQKTHEYFMYDRHDDGGYIMVMRRGDDLCQVVMPQILGQSAEETVGGTAWDFIEAKYVATSVTIAYSNTGTEMAE